MIRSLNIDNLRLQLGAMQGHEHRIKSIVGRAAELVAERLGERWPDQNVAPAPICIAHISVASRGVDLRMLTDEEAAREISTTLADAVLRRLQ